MKEINFNVRRDEMQIIHQIAVRAITELRSAIDKDHGISGVAMDITCTHANGHPLRLRELLEADNFNFAHDVLGVYRHLNRETGKLENHFHPRFSARGFSKQA